MNEVWVNIKEHEATHMVSNLGRIKSLERKVLFIKRGKPYSDIRKEKFLIGNNCSGYRQVSLNKKRILIHRIVASAFIPNPSNKPEVNHLNFIRTDNRVENLAWVTSKENNQHAFAKRRRVIEKVKELV